MKIGSADNINEDCKDVLSFKDGLTILRHF